MHPFILHNDRICEATSKLLCPGQLGVLSGWGVFSTLRVDDGVLFAWERHWARMQNDAALLRVPFPEAAGPVRDLIFKLLEANKARFATLRLSVVRNRGGVWEGPGIERPFDLIAFTTGLKDWGGGVRLSVAHQARHSASRFAGAKILSWAHNLVWLEEAQSRGFNEVILLNERDEVSECTSANVFVAEGNRVWTPPLHSGCLPGVTRDIILNELRVPGVEIGERDLRLADLANADEIFITSTTRDLLAVEEVEGIRVRRAGETRAALNKAFRGYIDAYVSREKSAHNFASPA